MRHRRHHTEYSSDCMCGYCKINKEVADRIRRFINNKGRWSEKRLAWRRKVVLGETVSSKNNTQPPITMPNYTNTMKQKPNYYKALQIAAAMTPRKENEN